nr:ribosomal RNA processing protein 36 homolog [Leptinotarsa decemlineata]
MTEEISSEERDKIREKLSSLSFEELLKMKKDMGAKLYNKTIYGEHKSKPKVDFQRANKNRPREVSSKVRPKKFNKHSEEKAPSTKKFVPRDPRFDPLCGQFDEKEFRANYKFLNDIRQNEKKELEKELKNCVNPERNKVIQLLIQRINNQLREHNKIETEELKKVEEKMEIRRKLKSGEKPNFKKKSVKKLEDLIDKYETLKKSNKLKKHIEKRSKKLIGKSKKKMNHEQEFR